MTIWFSSDLHWNHKNIIEYCNRPFSSVEEMNTTLIGNWNKRISPKDQVYFLGDLGLGGHKEISSYLEQLNGRIYLQEGNHDKKWFSQGFEHGRISTLPPLYNLNINKQLFVLCHYPLLTWLKSYYGSINLHGHCHGNIGRINESEDRIIPIDQKRGNRIDVGVDCWNYFPVSLEEILEFSNS